MDEAVADNLVLSWPKEDISTLIQKIQNVLPENDRQKYLTRIKRLDWKLVSFSNYTSDECREKWLVRSCRM